MKLTEEAERLRWRHESFQYASSVGPDVPLWCVTHRWAYDRVCLACLDELIRSPLWN